MRTMNAANLTLNQVLSHLGYTTAPAGNHRKDILKDGQTVLTHATANEVWQWLRSNSEI